MATVQGQVAAGFEEVRCEFERNFVERGEIGAAVAAFWHGDKVVDLWGGNRTPGGHEPWTENTMVVVMSITKGIAAMTLAVANARGWLDYDAPVARYWPEFAQNGKADITVRQLLAHEAGLVVLDERLTIENLRDLDDVARVLARQKPAWTPGTRHGYHSMTIGFYMQELIRRVDPEHRTLGRFFQEEIANPLQLEFYIGLPPEIPEFPRREDNPTGRGARDSGVLEDTAYDHPEGALSVVDTPEIDGNPCRRRLQRPTQPRGGVAGSKRDRHGACDSASLFGIRRGRCRDRTEPGNARPHYSGACRGAAAR